METINEIRTEASLELSRFLKIATEKLPTARHEHPFPMPRCFVDTLWHELEAEPGLSSDATLSSLVEMVSHASYLGQGRLPWLDAYHESYGRLGPAWFVSAAGVFREEEYQEYKSTGEWMPAWNCEPALRDEDSKDQQVPGQ